MKPIEFACEENFDQAPENIARQILELGNWADFRGYAFLPGIQSAEFERRTPEVVGTRIKVSNRDGSSHVEEIVAWDPERGLTLRFGDFSPPVSRLATGFEETWQFTRSGHRTHVVRLFKLYARSAAAWPVLWLISIFLKKAIARHLAQMREASPAT